MSKIDRVAWDTCVVIEAIQGKNPEHPDRWGKIEPYLTDARGGKCQIIVSEIVIAETKKLKDSKSSEPEQIEMISRWFMNPFIVRRAVHQGISELAAQIGRQYSIKRAADAIIVATTLRDELSELHTFDEKLLILDEQIGSPPLRIRTPDHPQRPLPYDQTSPE